MCFMMKWAHQHLDQQPTHHILKYLLSTPRMVKLHQRKVFVQGANICCDLYIDSNVALHSYYKSVFMILRSLLLRCCSVVQFGSFPSEINMKILLAVVLCFVPSFLKFLEF